MTQSDKPKHWPSFGWWSIWGMTFTASLLPPIVHHGMRIADIIEPLRYPSGLLPLELLILRQLGELSPWMPVLLIGLLAVGVYKHQARNSLIAARAVITALFSTVYTCGLMVVSVYLGGYSETIQRNQEGRDDLPLIAPPAGSHEPAGEL